MKFADFMREIEAEAQAEGPEAVAQLEAFREHFRGVRWNAACGYCKGYPYQEPDPECPCCHGEP